MFVKKTLLITIVLCLTQQVAFAWNTHKIDSNYDSNYDIKEPIVQSEDPTINSASGVYFATTSQKMFIKDGAFLWASSVGSYTLIGEVVVPEYTLNLNISGVTGADAINGFTTSQVITGLTSDYTLTGVLGDSTDLACTGTGVTGSGLSYLAGTASADVTADCVFSVASSGISDDFTRADEDPLASPWATASGAAGFNLTSNEIIATTVGALSYYDQAVSDDQYGQITYTGGGAKDAGLIIRFSGTSSSITGYMLSLNASTAGRVLKFVDGAVTVPTTLAYSTLTIGDIFKMSAVGTTITVYKNGSEIGSFTDSGVTSGKVGMYQRAGSLMQFDDFRAGDM